MVVIDTFIGLYLLEDWEYDSVDTFMEFQDNQEDINAKAAVMPQSLALTLFLARKIEERKTAANDCHPTGGCSNKFIKGEDWILDSGSNCCLQHTRILLLE